MVGGNGGGFDGVVALALAVCLAAAGCAMTWEAQL